MFINDCYSKWVFRPINLTENTQKNKSVMDQNEKYQYKFQYSLAHYQPISHQDPDQDSDFCPSDEETVLRRSNQLIEYKCFINKNTQQTMKTLFTHFIQLYGRVAVRLFRICERIYQNLQMSSSSFIRNFQEIIDHERQKLVENLSQLSQTFYDQKDKYFPLIALSVSASIFKILTLQRELTELQFQTVFHTVYWEMTGTHSTSQLLKKLMVDNFNGINFHQYLINEQLVKTYQAKSVTQSLVRNSDCFMKTSLNSSAHFSIKDMVLKSVRNEAQKQNKDIAFSKKIQRKEKLRKENSGMYINQCQNNIQIFNKKARNVDRLEIENQINVNEQWQKASECMSNGKALNFKKDRPAIYENYSNSKSGKKLLGQFGSSSGKKTTFASYLQQKKLCF